MSSYKSVFAKPTHQKVAEVIALILAPLVGAMFGLSLAVLIEEVLTLGLPTGTVGQVIILGALTILTIGNIGFWMVMKTLVSEYKTNEQWEQHARRRFEAEQMWKTN
jgi:hypothetical protein